MKCTTTTQLDESTQDLAASAYPVVLRIAERFAMKLPGLREEFESAVGLALCQSAARYDASIGVKFKTYAANRAAGACLDAMRNASLLGVHRGSKKSNPTKVGSIDVMKETTEDVLPWEPVSGDEPVGWEIESEDEVRETSRTLPAKVREVVQRLYLDASSSTMKGVGVAMNLSESRISQLHFEAKAMLCGEPTPEEIAEVEAKKAEIRLENIARHMRAKAGYHAGGRHALIESDHEQEGKRLKMLETVEKRPNSATAISCGNCPKCGRPFGKRRRCFACSPAIVAGSTKAATKTKAETESAGPAVKAPAVNGFHLRPEPRVQIDAPASDPFGAAQAELDAIRTVIDCLQGLSEPSQNRVRVYLAGLLEIA